MNGAILTTGLTSNAALTQSQEGVGVIDTVDASASGLWTSTYFASAHTLPEGTAAFTAAETVGGQTSDPSADWLVTVDETAPVVTLTAPATTASENPLLSVVVTDLNEPANGTAVTVKVYNAAGTTLLNTNTSAATITDGQASFRLAYTLTPGTTYQITASVNDLAGNTGTSAAQTVAVASVTTWGTATGQVLTSDPLGGDSQDQLGDVTDQAALVLDQSAGTPGRRRGPGLQLRLDPRAADHSGDRAQRQQRGTAQQPHRHHDLERLGRGRHLHLQHHRRQPRRPAHPRRATALHERGQHDRPLRLERVGADPRTATKIGKSTDGVL